MSEAMFDFERLPQPPGRTGTRLALAALPHLVPLVGLALFDWDLIEVATAYWAVLGAYLVVAVVWLWPVSRRLAGFFVLHGGVFWLASLQFVAGTAGDSPVPWLRLVLVAAASAGGLVLQELRLARVERAAGREPQGLPLIGRYYWRFMVFAISLFAVSDGTPGPAQGWILLGTAAVIEALLAMVSARWPYRVVRNKAYSE